MPTRFKKIKNKSLAFLKNIKHRGKTELKNTKKARSKIFEPKKIVSFLVLFSVIFQLMLPLIVFGQDENLPLPRESLTNPEIKQMEKISQSGGGWCIWSLECIIGRGMAFAGYWLLRLSAVALYMASGIFDVSADLSLSYTSYSSKTATAVYAGWRASRDFANLFFIFIILIIALALVLQMNQYYSKQVLVQLVMMAIFINFSFFMCQQIINLSNSAAIYFKNKAVAPGESLSSTFVKELDPQQLLGGYKPNIGAGNNLVPQEMQGKVNETLSAPDISLVGIIISSFGGVAIILTAAFILLAAAVLFIIRMVILWNLIILAPIAFIASILPDTKSHFSSWWNRFIKEVFFAPSMLFMFYIEMTILKSGFLKTYVSKNSVTGLGNSAVFNYYLMAMYIVMLLLLAKSLIFARSMGATGANHAIKYGNQARDWVKGKAGKIGKAPFYAAGRQARRMTAPAAEKVLTGDIMGGKFAKYTGAKALSRAIAKPLILSEKTRITDLEKRWEKLSGKEIAKEGAPPRTREALMAWLSQMQKKNSLGMVSPQRLQQIHGWMSQLGIDTRDIETYMPSLGKDEKAREKAVQRQQPDKVFEYSQNPEEYVNSLNTDNIRRNYGEQHLRELFKTSRTNDKSMESLLNTIVNYVDAYGAKGPHGEIDLNKIVKGLENDKNFSAAKFINTTEGNKLIEETINTQGRRIGYSAIINSKGMAEETAKEDLKLNNTELTNRVKDGSRITATDEQKLKTAEIIKSLDINRLTSILENLNATERQEITMMLKDKDIDQAKRVIKIDPTIIDAISGRLAPIEKTALNITTTANYVNQMPSNSARNMHHDARMNNNVIENLSRHQLDDLAVNGGLTNDEFSRIASVLRSAPISPELKTYLNESPLWKLMIP